MMTLYRWVKLEGGVVTQPICLLRWVALTRPSRRTRVPRLMAGGGEVVVAGGAEGSVSTRGAAEVAVSPVSIGSAPDRGAWSMAARHGRFGACARGGVAVSARDLPRARERGQTCARAGRLCSCWRSTHLCARVLAYAGGGGDGGRLERLALAAEERVHVGGRRGGGLGQGHGVGVGWVTSKAIFEGRIATRSPTRTIFGVGCAGKKLAITSTSAKK